MSNTIDETDYYPEPTCCICGKVCDIFEIHRQDEQMWAWCKDCQFDTFHEPIHVMKQKKKEELLRTVTEDLKNAKACIYKRFKFNQIEYEMPGHVELTLTEYLEHGFDLDLIDGFDIYTETDDETFKPTVLLIMHKKQDIKSRYADKLVDPNNYMTFKVTSLDDHTVEPKRLTIEEFRSGKAGIVFMDTATGKLIFEQ